MTCFAFIKLLRHLVETHMPGLVGTWMPRKYGRGGEYTMFYVDLQDGSYFRVTIEAVEPEGTRAP